MKRIFFIVLFVFNLVSADQNLTVENTNWMDDYHRFFTQKVHTFSHHLDEKLSSYDTLIETNATTLHTDKPVPSSVESDSALNDWFSSFFKDAIFDEAYTKSYALIKSTLKYDYKAKKFTPSTILRASLVLPKTKNRLSFFIEEKSNEYSSVNTHYDNELIEGTIGLRYTLPTKEYFHSYLSTGIHSGFENPFFITHVWIPYNVSQWRNRVSQTFKYSELYRFEEETRFYFDRYIEDDAMFRVNIGRSSREEVDGMKYFTSVAYNKTTKYNRGYQIGITTEGHTKPENEITKYALYGIYKQNIYRKWLFYEIEPRVEWEDIYDFEPNYVMLVSLEIFFGLD